MAAIAKLDNLDKASILEERMGVHKFRSAVAKLVSGGLFTPTHAILSDLRVSSATTNYDDLFERSSEEEVLRLPWDSGAILKQTIGTCHSLAKLHGCISHRESIVLTRKDYLRYGSLRQAVHGLIHQLLLTR